MSAYFLHNIGQVHCGDWRIMYDGVPGEPNLHGTVGGVCYGDLSLHVDDAYLHVGYMEEWAPSPWPELLPKPKHRKLHDDFDGDPETRARVSEDRHYLQRHKAELIAMIDEGLREQRARLQQIRNAHFNETEICKKISSTLGSMDRGEGKLKQQIQALPAVHPDDVPAIQEKLDNTREYVTNLCRQLLA